MDLLSYSGIVLNQDAIPTGTYTWSTSSGGDWLYQTFLLPSDYVRGVGTNEARIPDLSGIQVYVQVDSDQAATATLNYVFQYFAGIANGWIPITDGTVTGAETDGSTWMTLVFPQSIPVNDAWLFKEFRFGIQSVQGISNIGYLAPDPLGGQVFLADGVTQLLNNDPASLNFRLLALTADSGVNFLGDAYRSVVITTDSGNVSTTDGGTPVGGSGQSPYWLSPPSPSRFAVHSMYFDMRPVAIQPSYGLINYVEDPSFEYDLVGSAPSWWTAFTNGGSTVDQTVSSAWAYDRLQSLHMKYTFTTASQQRGIESPYIQIEPAATSVSISLGYKVVSTSHASAVVSLLWFDSTHTLLSTSSSTLDPTLQLFSETVAIPTNTVYVEVLISGLSTAAGALEAYVDGIQLTFTEAVQAYFDGDTLDCQWTGQRGQSASVQLVTASVSEDTVVIDGVLVDPLTPNMAFNVYYSQDDSGNGPNMSESDWEQKLWTRVPQVYLSTQRQQYIFPTPIVTKYVKLEFTNLQAKPYDPGNFAKPVTYKKFPTWVATFFLAQLGAISFVDSQVQVVYDALSFAYDYYLDDLHQEPLNPVAPPTDAISQLTSYFSSSAATTGVDATTLAQINLALQPFQYALGSTVDTSTILGGFVNGLLAPNTNGLGSQMISTTEGSDIPAPDLTTVSSLNRESVVLEHSMPVMYFFLTCRHSYKELSAPFDYHRAYFAGVRDVAFIRNNYTVAADTPLYIEPGADSINIDFTDWTL